MALAILTSPKSTGGGAEVALVLLRNAARAAAMAKAASYKTTNATMVSLPKASTSKTPGATNDQPAEQVNCLVNVSA
jgi:hypothetical protein